MSTKTVIILSVSIAAALVLTFFIGRSEGRRQAATNCSQLTTTDTLWQQVHDTAFVEVETLREVVRRDTVRLAVVDTTVSKMESVDTMVISKMEIVHDSIYVEVPISLYTFEGEDYRITAEGYAVALRDVWFNQPTIVQTQTITKTKRWAFAVGAQVGYGITMGGWSPYAGLGFTFGYVF